MSSDSKNCVGFVVAEISEAAHTISSTRKSPADQTAGHVLNARQSEIFTKCPALLYLIFAMSNFEIAS